MGISRGRFWLTEDGQSVVIDADPVHVYGLVADLPRMGEWSPECERVEWLHGATEAVVGAQFVGHNRGGPFKRFRWSRHGRVLVADPGREVAFITDEGGARVHGMAVPIRAGRRRHSRDRVLRGAVDSGLGAHTRRAGQPPSRTA